MGQRLGENVNILLEIDDISCVSQLLSPADAENWKYQVDLGYKLFLKQTQNGKL